MLSAIRRWLGLDAKKALSQSAIQQLNEIAPLKSSAEEGASANRRGASSFICREPMLDRNERISGYAFGFGRKLQARMSDKSALIRSVYDDALLQNLAPLATSLLLGERMAFIRLSAASLNHSLLKIFSGLNVVILISPVIKGEADIVQLRASIRNLQEINVRYGWTLVQAHPELHELLQEADIIEIETPHLDGIQLKILCRDLHAYTNKPKLIASEVLTTDDYSLCFHCGFDNFMGAFITNRDNWHPAKSEINRLRVFEVLNLIRADAGFDAIADSLRGDPILTFKLLRYINSPGIGLLQKIDEISQALLILGGDKFYRWLSLLLFDLRQQGYQTRVLNEQALARARLMELLAGHGNVPDAPEQLFITGLFSLLDVMMGQPLAEILKQVSLPDIVLSALQGEAGGLRPVLLLAMAVESGSPQEISATAAHCGLDAQDVTALMIAALQWSQQVVSVGE